MVTGPVLEDKENQEKRRTATTGSGPQTSTRDRKSLKGMTYDEQREALRPKDETPTLRELYPDHPLLKDRSSPWAESGAGALGAEKASNTSASKGLAGSISTEGATVSVEGKKVKVDLAVLRSPPASLTEDGMLAAVRVNPKGTVRLTAGGGYLPKLYGIVPGPKAVSEEPRVLAFVSMDASGKVVQIPAPAGCTFTLEADGHITLVAPMDLSPAPGPLGDLGRHVDATALLGTSNVDASVRATVSKPLGEGTTAEVGYTGFVDVLFNAARYEMGGKGPPLASHVVGASVEHRTPAADYKASAVLPLSSPTNRLPTSPQASATVHPHHPLAPDASVVAGPVPGGVQYVGLSKEFQAGRATIHAAAGVERPFDAGARDFKASVSARIPIGGGGGGGHTFHHDLYSHVREGSHGPVPEPRSYSPDDVFAPDEKATLEAFVKRVKEGGKAVGEADLRWLSDFLRTPERLAAFHNGYWEYDYERLAKYMGGEGLRYDRSAYSPLESLSRMKSVCCDYSALWTSLLTKQGYEARTVAYLGADTGHVVCAYRDKNGKWNVIDNGYIIPVQAGSFEDALSQAIPEAWCFIEYDRPADDLRPVPIRKTETRDLQRILAFIRGEG